MPAKLLSRTKLFAGTLAVLAAVALPRAADAQIINFAGFTNGCFNVCNVQSLSTSSLQVASAFSAQPLLLTYQNSQFNTSVANGGTVSLNDPNSKFGTQNFNNFGAFYVLCNRTCTQNLNTTFTLMITLTSPTSQQVIFNGLLTGVLQSGAQGFNLSFTNTPQNVTWSSGGSNGTANISINNIATGNGIDAFNLNGSITARVVQVTPEPATMVLFGTGLFGLFGVARRRRKNVA